MMKLFFELKNKNVYSIIALIIAIVLVQRRFSLYKKYNVHEYTEEEKKHKVMNLYKLIFSFLYPLPE